MFNIIYCKLNYLSAQVTDRRRGGQGDEDPAHELGRLTTQKMTITCVPSFFCPRNRTTSEVVVRRA